MLNQNDESAMDFAPVRNSDGIQIEPGRYLVKLLRFERMEDGDYGARRRWVFGLADPVSRQGMFQQDGQPATIAMTTSTKMGKKSNARKLFVGLLGRELEDGEDGRAIAQEALGKKAIALIGPNQNGWIEILSLSPEKGTNGNAAHEPVAAAVGAGPDPFAED